VPWLAMQGRFAEAERQLARRAELSSAVSAPQHDVSTAAMHLNLALWQGRAALVAPALRDLTGATPFPIHLIVQWVLVRGGRIEEARAEHDRSGLPEPSDDWMSVMHHCTTAEIAHGLGLPDAAARAYRSLAPYAGRCCTAGYGISIGPVDAFLALAAAATGERETARRHAEAALELCAAWEIPLAAEWVRGLGFTRA
jgi:hypothetical protein